MKHELVIPESADINSSARAEKRMAQAFCGNKEYGESKYDFPIVLGSDDAAAPIIEDLPTLGNVLLFGKVTGASTYYLTILAQLLWARHPLPLDVDVFAYPINWLCTLCTEQTQYSFGKEKDFSAFLDNIRSTIQRRRSGEEDIRRRKVFVVYIVSGHLKALDRDVLGEIFNENLAELGLQVVVCGESGSASLYLKDLAGVFDTVIETMCEYGRGMPQFGVITRQKVPYVFSLYPL